MADLSDIQGHDDVQIFIRFLKSSRVSDLLEESILAPRAGALLPGPRGKFRCIFIAKFTAYCS
jgi:hypothetical protein